MSEKTSAWTAEERAAIARQREIDYADAYERGPDGKPLSVAWLRAPSPEAVEERRPCEVCAPDPCKGHEVVSTVPATHWKVILK